MNTYLIALGSNEGDREYYIQGAIEAIRRNCGEVLKVAPILESEPLGPADGRFLNTALLCHSALEPDSLLQALWRVEQSLGRVRTERWGNRTIDCDIILWRTEDGRFPSFQSPTLSIPHPEARHRDFVMEPAAAIAGSWDFPETGSSVDEIWQEIKKKRL